MKRSMLMLTLLLLGGAAVADDVVVIVNPANPVALSRKDIANLFLGKTATFPDGTPAKAVALKDGSAERDEFNRRFLNKTNQQLDSYWAALIFTGRVIPPRQVATEAEVRALVESNRDYIGFVRESAAGKARQVR
jgi:hypothetical protein